MRESIESLDITERIKLERNLILGCRAYLEQDYDSAINHYLNIHKMPVNKVWSNYYLGMCYEQKGDLNLAFKYLLDSVSENTNFIPANLLLAKIMYKVGKHEAAIHYICTNYEILNNCKDNHDLLKEMLTNKDFITFILYYKDTELVKNLISHFKSYNERKDHVSLNRLFPFELEQILDVLENKTTSILWTEKINTMRRNEIIISK